MKVAEKYKGLDGGQIWDVVVDYVERRRSITTVTGIVLSATFVGSCIFIKGGTPGTKRADKGEYLTGKDFIAAWEVVKDWNEINTGNVKPYIRRQQTPFIALLHCAGVLI
ncbi:MAG: hypothetical protein ACI3ZS_10245 [Candidatus Cryptobacteroides sp.]